MICRRPLPSHRIPWRQLARNLRSNRVRALTVSATNIRTGEILAMASFPTVDPRQMSTQAAQTQTANVDRAAGARYEMGSTFKIFSFAMGLDSGKVTLNNMYDGITEQALSPTIRPSSWGPSTPSCARCCPTAPR